LSHPALLVPNAEALAAAPARAEPLAREAEEAARAADAAKKTAATAVREQASRAASLRKLESLKKSADAEAARAEKALDTAKTDDARAKAEERKQKATAKATEAAIQLDAAKADAASKLDPAAAKEAAKAAEAKKAAAAKAALEAKLALEPVSVYISRATSKLYVRRNTHKPAPDGGGTVYDATIEVPVAIRDPFKPIGTHVFTAVANDGAGLRWTAVTIDNADEARNALDRITIPKDVLDRIAPTALPRSSIIVSDEPLSEETNYRTEFVAVLSNHPQGGFITRERTPVYAAADPYGDEGSWFFGRGWGSQSGSSPQRGWGYQGGWGPQPGPQRTTGPQPGAQRSGGSLTGPQQGWGPDNSWRGDDRYFRREQQRW
jgi:hypothetical protein